MVDTLMIGFQTFILLLLAKSFVKTPLKLYGCFVAFVKTFFVFLPTNMLFYWFTEKKELRWEDLPTNAFVLSSIAVLVVSAVKAVLHHFDVQRIETRDDSK